MKIYVVTMYRYGEREKHSYLLGAWSTLEVAKSNANVEIMWRAQKYLPEIVEVVLDEPNDIEREMNTVVLLGDMR